jgi:hypothetical protein
MQYTREVSTMHAHAARTCTLHARTCTLHARTCTLHARILHGHARCTCTLQAARTMRTIAFSRATHNRLYVRTSNHHYDYILKRKRCSAPFVFHIIYAYIYISPGWWGEARVHKWTVTAKLEFTIRVPQARRKRRLTRGDCLDRGILTQNW